MKRKIILGLLTVACATSLAFGFAACDNSGGTQSGTGKPSGQGPNYTPPADTGSSELLKFELNDDKNGYIVTGLADGVTDENIKIPATYNKLPVVEIGERAFGSCHTIKSVTISEGVSVIGSGAFTDCVNIPSFKFPASITTISDSAFQNCSGLYTVSFNGTSKLEEIYPNAFQNCTKLINVNIPDSVVTLGDRVFQNCTALKSVTIGNGVETVGVETFRGCSALTTVNIGDGLKEVGTSAFLNCDKITEIVFPNSLEKIGLGALKGCTSLKNLTIPFVGSQKYDTPVSADEVKTSEIHTNFGYIFGANNFDDHYSLNLDSLETLTITGDSPIGYHSFQSIGRFADSTETTGIGLSTINITGNVKIIDVGAFQGCFNLQTLVLPKSLTTINAQILEVGIIKHIYYCGTATDWSKINVDSGNMGLFGSSRYYYSETAPAPDDKGNYWRYVDGVPTDW